MIRSRGLLLQPGPTRPDLMSVVETDEAHSLRVVKREGIGETVWTLFRPLDTFNFELDPITPFKVVNAAIEREQKFQCVIHEVIAINYPILIA